MVHTNCQFRGKHTVGGIVFYKHAFLVFNKNLDIPDNHLVFHRITGILDVDTEFHFSFHSVVLDASISFTTR